MAIIKCYDCGGDVSSNAFECPHCGADLSINTRLKNHVTKQNESIRQKIKNYITKLDIPNKVKNNKFKKVLIGILVIIFLTVGSFFAYKWYDNYLNDLTPYNLPTTLNGVINEFGTSQYSAEDIIAGYQNIDRKFYGAKIESLIFTNDGGYKIKVAKNMFDDVVSKITKRCERLEQIIDYTGETYYGCSEWIINVTKPENPLLLYYKSFSITTRYE